MNRKRFFEETVSSSMLFKGEVVGIRKDIIKSRRGQFSQEIVEHPGAVAIVPIIGENMVMVKQLRYSSKKIMLELPAGTLEKDENPDECARRELIEETGYIASSLKKMLQFYVAPGYDTEIVHIYLATNLIKNEQKLDKYEDIDVLKISVNDILLMIKKNEIDDAKSIAGILYYQTFINSLV